MIDLHCHTTNSDGTDITIQLLKKAEDLGITLLSITDHDTTKAYYDIDNINIKDYYTGKIITGTEINCIFDNIKIELLGYGFDKEPVQEWLDTLYGKDAVRNNMIKEFNDMKNICERNNVKISKNISYNPDKEYPIDVIYFDVIKYEENKKLFDKDVWNSQSLFFRKCTTDKEFILYRDFTKDYPTAETVSNIIRQNNGKVFLAHIFIYNLDSPMEFLEKITSINIVDGVETYYSKFTNEQIEKLEKFCKENNLLMSGGSDYHGDRHKELILGKGYGNLNVNEYEINKWVKKLINKND